MWYKVLWFMTNFMYNTILPYLIQKGPCAVNFITSFDAHNTAIRVRHQQDKKVGLDITAVWDAIWWITYDNEDDPSLYNVLSCSAYISRQIVSPASLNRPPNCKVKVTLVSSPIAAFYERCQDGLPIQFEYLVFFFLVEENYSRIGLFPT